MTDSTTPIISVKGLEKTYGNLNVLKGIDLDLKRGDVLGIIGPSGSGKSTLIRCLNMMETPTPRKMATLRGIRSAATKVMMTVAASAGVA